MTWRKKKQFSQRNKLIKMFHASTFIFPNMKRSNSDRCPQLQGVCKVWKGKVSPKADLNYGFLILSYLNKSIWVIFPQKKEREQSGKYCLLSLGVKLPCKTYRSTTIKISLPFWNKYTLHDRAIDTVSN